jgi:hypothetical protein
LQQTESTQKPEPHWLLPLQETPEVSLGMQMPAAQKSPKMQSPSTAQSPRHAVAPQIYGLQD